MNNMFDVDSFTLTLAQAGPGNGVPAPPLGEDRTLAPGGTPGTPANGGATGSGLGGILPLLFIAIVAMLFFSILGQRRERKKREAMISTIKKHDRVQTIGGIIGSIVELKPDTVVLKVDESSNTRITFARSAIQQVIKSSPEITAG
jgi:preprotein translocase subunit YajC